MNETHYDPDDPLFLLSRSLDEDLPEDERRKLNQALAASQPLRARTDEFRKLHRLLKRWADDGTVDLDWEHHAALAKARAEDADETDELDKVDRLLRRWGNTNVILDADAFTAAVMAKVQPKRPGIMRLRTLFRTGERTEPSRTNFATEGARSPGEFRGEIGAASGSGRNAAGIPVFSGAVGFGAPLAAAAAIALAVTATLWLTRSPRPHVDVVLERGVSTGPSRDRMTMSGTADVEPGHVSGVAVSFVRTPIDQEACASAPSAISFGTVGASAGSLWSEEMPPI